MTKPNEDQLYFIFYVETYLCDVWPFNDCDPYVKVYVGGEEVLKTATADGKNDYNVDRIYHTKKIKKSTIIAIEVWEDDSKKGEHRNEGNSQPILWTNGTVESFMQNPTCCTDDLVVGKIHYGKNCIEVDIIWQDERNDNNDM